MKTKRTLISIITLCAALSLTACNGSGSATTENSQKTQTESTTEAVDNSNTKLDDLYQQENRIFAEHKDIWDKLFGLMNKNTANRSIGEQKVKSSNMVFLPPLGMRFFDIHALLPYSIEVSNVLLDAIHRLWVMLLDMYKVDKGSIYLNVRPGTLTIEDEKN